jgi:dTDP-4-amino-4,6-dideoxygalactose transaminase
MADVKVPFLDLKAQYAPIRAEVEAALREILDNTAFILGPGVQRFEEAFAPYAGRKHCVGLNSGTSALHLALLAAGVGPGDEVVTTPHTWISTSWAVSYCGAKPVYADVDPKTGNLDPAAADKAITGKTKALLPVDLYGNPADLVAFEEIARRRKVVLIEDAAQSHGARLDGRPTGAFGSMACFSFYPGKNLGAAGEGGAVVTDDAALADRIRRLRDHAQSGRHNHVEIGFNYRMEGVQGAILAVKLRHLDAWNRGRREAAARYREMLAGIPGLVLPEPTKGADPVWHLYVVRVKDRDRVAARLGEAGIGTGVHYPKPVHLQPAYAHLGHRAGAFPQAEAFAAECLSLPMYAEITASQQEAVARALRAALKGG